MPQNKMAKAKFKQGQLPRNLADKVIDVVDEDDDDEEILAATVAASASTARKLSAACGRVRITDAERAWLLPQYDEFLKLPHHNHRHPKVVAFKKKLADDFVKTFKFSDRLEKHRERAIRFLSNEKRKTTQKQPDKKDNNIIMQFFGKNRRVSGRKLFLQTRRPEMQRRIRERKVDGKKKSGLNSTISREMWDELSDDEQENWQSRAQAQDAQRIDELTDEDVAANQDNLQPVMERLLTAILGRGQPYSVGDAVFHFRYAFRTIDGDVKTDIVDVGPDGTSFCVSEHYKKKFDKAWKAYARESLALNESGDEDVSAVPEIPPRSPSSAALCDLPPSHSTTATPEAEERDDMLFNDDTQNEFAIAMSEPEWRDDIFTEFNAQPHVEPLPLYPCVVEHIAVEAVRVQSDPPPNPASLAQAPNSPSCSPIPAKPLRRRARLNRSPAASIPTPSQQSEVMCTVMPSSGMKRPSDKLGVIPSRAKKRQKVGQPEAPVPSVPIAQRKTSRKIRAPVRMDL